MTMRHSKLADPRYIPGVSEYDDDMTDDQWFEAMGEPVECPIMQGVDQE